jgi:hypothetical protein
MVHYCALILRPCCLLNFSHDFENWEDEKMIICSLQKKSVNSHISFQRTEVDRREV